MPGIFWFLPDARHKLAFYINNNHFKPDMVLMRFFNEKSVWVNFNHPPAYAYLFTGIFGLGLFIGTWLRALFCTPDMVFRRMEYYKPWPDKHWTWAHSMPYYNHSLRNWSAKYRASFVDNEPDFNAFHPWAVRPNRNMHYGRCPMIVGNQRYLIDDPNFEKNLHANMEARYEALGYYPDRKKKAQIEDEENLTEEVAAAVDAPEGADEILMR